MTEPLTPPDGQLTHPSVHHEPTDISFRAIMIGLIVAIVFAVIVHVAVFVFLYVYRDEQAKVKKSPFPLAPAPSTTSTTLPTEPRLEQLDRLAEIETPDVYKREEIRLEKLNRYGATKEEGFIHVPIGRAMEFLANKLPARPEPSAEQKKKSGGLLDAGEPNSGRKFRRSR